MNPLQKTLIPLFRRTLDAYSERHTAISENIANVRTKNFRPLQIHFEEELQRALEKNRPIGKTSNDRHMHIGRTMDAVRAKVEEKDARINIEGEMAELARNQIRFDFVARKLHGSFEHIKSAIRGRAA